MEYDNAEKAEKKTRQIYLLLYEKWKMIGLKLDMKKYELI